MYDPVCVEKKSRRIQCKSPYRKVLEKPGSHYICGYFGKDASFLLPLFIVIILISRAWRCQTVVQAVSCNKSGVSTL